jgi:hypothetical protein
MSTAGHSGYVHSSGKQADGVKPQAYNSVAVDIWALCVTTS